MKVTAEILRFYAPTGNESFIEEFERDYPEGIEFLDLLAVDREQELNIAHFVYTFCYLSEEETQQYLKRCNIDEQSRFVWNSAYIKNSTSINWSHNITDSSNIYAGIDIKNTKCASYSNSIEASEFVKASSNIEGGFRIYKSNEVSYSDNIYYSKMIEFSRYIIDGKNLKNCERLSTCTDCSDCYCSTFLHNCDHCLFCLNLTNKSYYIFNEEVTKEAFTRCKEWLVEMLQAENEPLVNIHEKNYVNFSSKVSISGIFNTLSDNFFEQVKVVPNVTELKFITLFFKQW